MYIGNLIIYYLLSHAIEEGVQSYPTYIYFLSCGLNDIPEILNDRKEIGIVLQKQYENLFLDIRYISVTLYFKSKSYDLKIDISTIYSIEVVGKGKISLDYRLANNYISKISDISSTEYYRRMKKVSSYVDKSDVDIMKMNTFKPSNEDKKAVIINIEDIIKTSEDENGKG